jgi:hypothetical protein
MHIFPTYNYDTKEWGERSFKNKKEVIDFLRDHFKYPGEYNLKYANGYWNEQALHFEKHKSYPKYVPNSIDYRKHWKFESKKSEFKGFTIYYSEEENLEYVLPGLYYWYLNYCMIPNKLVGRPTLPGLWDSDLHYFIYILRCQWEGKFGALVKKRQWGSSLKNLAIIANSLWFGEAWTAKIFAIDESQVKDSWLFLEMYADHINTHTAFKRGFEPRQTLNWIQRVKTKDGSRFIGRNNKAVGITTSASPTKGVGGDAKVIFGEEAGVNKTIKKTHNYLKSNVAIGGAVTGLIIYAGAVGELEHADGLKDLILEPEANGILAVPNRIEEDIKEFGILETGLFVPEWFNYISINEETGEFVKCYDEHGNSDYEMSMKYIAEYKKKIEKLKPEDYLMETSQHPNSLKEAFSHRKEAMFPQSLLTRQLHRIDRGDYPYQSVDLERTSEGIQMKKNTYPAIVDWPYKPKKGEIPYGCVQVWEEPEIDESTGKPPWGMYFAGVDVIQVDQSTTSDSLFSIHIYKNITEVAYIDDNGEQRTRIEGDKIVAKYVGRKKSRKETNDTGFKLIEFYNAFAVIENNFDNFIQDGIRMQKQKHMALKEDLPFLRELMNKGFTSSKDYGVRTNETIWTTQFEDKSLEYIKEEVGAMHNKKGETLKTVYGVEKVPDRMLIKEWLGYDPDDRKKKKKNYDSMVSFGLALAIAKARQANHLISKIDESKDKKNPYQYDKYKKPIMKSLSTRKKRYRGFRNLK